MILFFYFFAGLTLLSASLVVLARNTMISVFALILTFLSSSGLFLLAGAEFLALVLIVVYVGSVTVFFLFVIMLIPLPVKSKLNPLYILMGGLVGLCFLGCLLVLLRDAEKMRSLFYLDTSTESFVSSAKSLGQALYTTYFLPFQLTGLILFVAMVGAIILVIRHRENAKHQSIAEQKGRQKSLRLLAIPFKKGL